jgi:UDPglucose 6-dehydrogenase
MDIGVIGAGYVGLTTAACLAEIGHRVFCADNDLQKLDMLRKGDMPFFEPYLDSLVQSNRVRGRLEFTSQTEGELSRGEAIFICVGTPSLENGETDLSAIEQVGRIIAQRAREYRLIVEKSTVPVLSGYQLQKHLALYRGDDQFQFDVVANPEFLRQGSAVEDLLHPDRIVVGVDSSRAAELMGEIYRPLLEQSFVCPVHSPCKPRPPVPLVLTDLNSAEMIKHAANSFLAMKISFINMVADLCEATGADIEKVAEGIGLDPRIGAGFLRPGIGFGGSCFPKDLRAFVRTGEKFGCDFSLLKEVERINARRIDHFFKKIKDELWVLRGKRLGVWGLAFKPNTDDIRRAPSLEIIRRLLAEGAQVQAYDPQAMEKAKTEVPQIGYCKDPYEAARAVDALLLLTEWEEFRTVDWERVRGLVARPLLIDGRNLFSAAELASQGFQYIGLGRNASALTEAEQVAFKALGGG